MLLLEAVTASHGSSETLRSSPCVGRRCGRPSSRSSSGATSSRSSSGATAEAIAGGVDGAFSGAFSGESRFAFTPLSVSASSRSDY